MVCSKFKKNRPLHRTIRMQHSLAEYDSTKKANKQFIKNKIISSYYTWWNFLPINIFQQFHSIANFFFLVVCIMFFFGETPINPGTVIGPLTVVIGISIIKDAFDDFKRHRSDKELNYKQYTVFCQKTNKDSLEWNLVKAQEIRCGEIIICRKNHSFPCDILILASSASNGKVMITTDNLDGESSMKTFYSLPATQSSFLSFYKNTIDKSDKTNKVDFPSASVICQEPTEDLNEFEGRLEYSSQSIPLRHDNLALRGATLRYTDYIIGMVIYTGFETKLSMNGKQGNRKFSSTARRFNTILLTFIIVMLLLTIMFVGFQFAFRQTDVGYPWYLTFSSITPWSVFQEGLTLTFILNYLIPISIVVTMDLQQLAFALFLTKDIEFYDPESGNKSKINATNLADELGQVEFLFSDKTGTLTQNKMEFRSYALANDKSIYNLENNEIFLIRDSQTFSNAFKASQIDLNSHEEVNKTNYFYSSSESEDEDVKIQIPENLRRPSLFKFKIKKLSEEAQTFWTIAALCHTIEAKFEIDPDSKQKTMHYSAISPDEKALVVAASRIGFKYIGLDTTNVNQNIRGVHLIECKSLSAKPSKSVIKKFYVDAVIDFDSIRKRMSIMVQHEDGRHFIYTKGAEVAMLNARLCSKTSSQVRDDIIKKVTNFACTGLRTLVFGLRELSAANYQDLLSELQHARGLIGSERNKALEIVNAKIESRMSLVGVSGVEDKLQPGVKHCLQSLLSAGIQVWVLTGDKEETAVQVSQAAGHFPQGLSIVRLVDGHSIEDVARSIYVQAEGMQMRLLEKKKNWWSLPSVFKLRHTINHKKTDVIRSSSQASHSTLSDFEIENPEKTATFFEKISGGFRDALTDGLRRNRRKNPGGANEPVGLVIDGQTFQYAISPALRKDFLKLCMSMTTVLCCRMTPLQKAAVVQLVSQGLQGVGGKKSPITAAVGDGGNDVAMLLQASVGIGIFGNEGRQAVRSCDYAIPLFKHLRRLLLVHGQWDYYRISITANLFYFKCTGFVAVHIYHFFYNAFSGQSLFESLLYTLYNLTMTAFSCLVFGIFEKHLSDKELIHRPYLYRTLNQNGNLRAWYIALWVLEGFWHGTVSFYGAYYFLVGGGGRSAAVILQPGIPFAQFDQDLFGNAIFIYLVVSTNMRIILASRVINLFIIIGVIGIGFLNLALMIAYQFAVPPSSIFYLNYNYLAMTPAFWLSLPVVITFSLLPGLIWRIISDAWWDYQLALSGVKRIREKRKQLAWNQFAIRTDSESSTCV